MRYLIGNDTNKDKLLGETKKNIDKLFNHALDERTSLGVRVSTAEKVRNLNDENILNMKGVLSLDQDVDQVEKFIELKSAEMVYQASIQVGAKSNPTNYTRLYEIIRRANMEILFEKGIPGFEEYKTFEISEIEGNEKLKMITSTEDPNIGFVAISPFEVKKDYEIDLNDEIINDIKNRTARRCIFIKHNNIRKNTRN